MRQNERPGRGGARRVPRIAATTACVVTAAATAAAVAPASAAPAAAGRTAAAEVYAPPEPPVNVRITGLTAHSVTVAWDAVAGPGRYLVSRTSPGYSSFVKLDTTSYRDTGVAPGQRHHYEIRFLAMTGSSRPASVDVVTPLPARAAAAKRKAPGLFRRTYNRCISHAVRRTPIHVDACLSLATRTVRKRR